MKAICKHMYISRKVSVIFLVLICSYMPGKLLANQNCQKNSILASTPSERFLQKENNIVIDLQTGLMWRRCMEGVSGSQCENNKSILFSWQEALLYSKNINRGAGVSGFNDWRLPNIRELSSITELQCENPAINIDIFPGTPSSLVWSASPYSFYPHYSWFVDFANGTISYGERGLKLYNLRLVRQVE